MAKICTRPGCGKQLKTGSKYCSNSCAAIDRKRVRAEMQETPMVPLSLSNRISDAVGAEKAQIIVSEVNRFLQEEVVDIPIPLSGSTYGDLVLSYDGTQDYRPSTQLSFDVIDKMLRSGPVIFAMEMKRAQVCRVFSQGRYKVVSPDTELAEVADAALRPIMPKMADDFTYSAFAYGASYQEEEWEWKSKYQLGMSTNRNAQTKFLVPKVPKSVKPSTISHIRRTANESFNGFAQKKKMGVGTIDVDAQQALVIPLNSRFGNLHGQPVLHSMYIDWLWYEIIFRTMARYMERMATPTALAKAPSRATVTMSGSSNPIRAMDLALALAGSLSKANAIAIPSDTDEDGRSLWDIGYLTADERAQPFLDVLEYLAQCMIRDALSADRSLSQSSGGVGSYNIGEVHAAASAVTSEMILLQFLHYLNLYFMPEFSLYNRGAEGPPIWLKTQSIDMQERALLMQLIGVAGNSPAAQELFYLVDWRTLTETGNIPTLPEEKVTELKEQLNKEQADKMREQQEIMAQNQKPVPQGGASMFRKPNENKQPAPANGNTKTEAELELEAYRNIFGDGIPWTLGAYEAQILYENGVINEETLKLFNPFHDNLGKFAPKAFSGVSRVGNLADGIKQQRAAKIKAQMQDDLLSQNEYEERYKTFSKAEQKFLVPPAKYLAGKGIDNALIRGGVDFASDIAIRRTIAGLVYSSAYMLGVVGASYLGITGVLPLSIAGVAIGVASSFALAGLVSRGKDDMFAAYLNRYAPTGNKYVTMSAKKQQEKRQRSRKVDVGVAAMDWIMPLDNIAVLAYEGFSTVGSVAGSATSPLYGLEEVGTDGNDYELFMTTIYPNVCDMVINKDFTIVVPFDVPGLEEIGFYKQEKVMVLDASTCWKFIEVWNNETFPKGRLEFGNVTYLEEGDAETIQLFNPFHGDDGRFASKAGSAGAITSAAGLVALVGAIASQAVVESRVASKTRATKKEGETLKDARERVLKSKAISMKVGGKTVEASYEQVIRFNQKTAKAGLVATYTGALVWGMAQTFRGPSGPRTRGESSYKKRADQQWPKSATEQDFKNMYRTLARRYHPDVGGDTATMQQINEFYSTKNWGGIQNLYSQLEEAGYTREEIEGFVLIVTILREALKDDSEYIVFPTEEKEIPPFVVEDGEMIFDRDTAQLIVDAFDAILEKDDTGNNQS